MDSSVGREVAMGLVLRMLGRGVWKGKVSRITMISTAGTGVTEINTAAIRRSGSTMAVSREVASGTRR